MTRPPKQCSRQNLIEAVNAFTLTLHRHVLGQGASVCGINVFSCLLMVAYGFQSASRQGIMEALGLGDVDIESASTQFSELDKRLRASGHIHSANSVWHRDGVSLSTEFVDFIRQHFHGVTGRLDGEAIRAHIRENTKDKIDPQRMDIPDDMALMLVACIYFKADWRSPFDRNSTFDWTFHPFDAHPVPCRLMVESDEMHLYYQDDSMQAILLPYARSNDDSHPDWAAAFILPRDNSEEALVNALSSKTDPQDWQQFLASFSPKTVDIYIPQFNLQAESEILPALASMGMDSATQPSQDFWARSPPEQMWISGLTHATFLKCDEVGTEVAAATITDITDGLSDEEFRADRPFWFAVVDRGNGMILFSSFVRGVESS